jgi:hydroxypyruvate reductase
MRRDMLRIWRAGVDAVGAERLVTDALRRADHRLIVQGEPLDLDAIGRITVVGAGKAGAGMAAAVEQILGPELLAEKRVTGWVNVPQGCERSMQAIHLHPARPEGCNEPTLEAVAGAERILEMVGAMQPDDLCLALISGGASALLPAPSEGITLEDKLQVTRLLSGRGANIQQLNTVRKQLSRIKGGGLPRACRAGRIITLVISDVPGDPLDVIGSGPTQADNSTPQDALAVLEQFDPARSEIPQAVWNLLNRRASQASGASYSPPKSDTPERGEGSPAESHPPRAETFVIGNNAQAVDAAGAEAERLGYSHAMVSSPRPEGQAEDVGRHLARLAQRMRNEPGPDCLISGGEPVVTLCDAAQRGLGGRNQQLTLAALEWFEQQAVQGVGLLSGGTDGEDGPTDAAGAWLDDAVRHRAQQLGLEANPFLKRNDAYHFFEACDALLKTGPTHTNVCDLRIVLVDRRELSGASRVVSDEG